MDEDRLRGALATFATSLVRDYDLETVLARLSSDAVAVLEVDGAGLTLRAGGRTQYVTATDAATQTIEAEQDRLQEGPCMEAMATGRTRAVHDVASESEWPAYRDVALERNLHAMLGVPVLLRDDILGALNVYARRPRAWSVEELRTAQLLADMASAYVANAQNLASQLRQILGGPRTSIEFAGRS